MSVARSSECVFCLFSRSSRPASLARRQFHSSPIHQKRKPRFPSVRATANQIDINTAAAEFPSAQNSPDLQRYPPEQRAAIEAARKLIDPEKLQSQTGNRTDPWKIKYYDDLSKVDPVVDKPVRHPWTNLDDSSRLKTEDEFEEDLVKLMHEIPAPRHENDFDTKIWDRFDENLRLTVGKEEAERRPPTAMAPGLPKISPQPKKKRTDDRRRDEDAAPKEPPSPAVVRLMQMTGYNKSDLANLRVKTIFSNSVSNQTRLGKVHKTYFLTVAGNRNGLIGIGEGKGEETADAIMQSQYRAIRNMQPIMRYEDRTTFGDLSAKVSATELELYARPPGFGLRCQKYIWEICKCAGIHDLAARVTRSRNPMNTIKATIHALLGQKHPEDIARARGKKLVDVRKVYYAGRV
ncbi:30S ribosomal protein S5 [Exophiala viscosa]|uniref:Small ribosomal subunit protein uS5m n=1 Tax=Exophiala viscosa TaxID=2486360 RepID=A0AAN6IAV1_9EURO|nr:30S ribosomal protein S5 [Exophiala viscosa]